MTKSILEIATDIRNQSITPVDLLEECFANIDRYESKVHAWVTVDRERALADAKRLTDETKTRGWRSLIHGIPIGVKDIMDVFDWPTGCGSKRWANSFARRDAEIVRLLRDAGAVFIGKTVTTQWASFDPPVTRNPWNLERTPGGSSSGSAAAVACGMCIAALGSQTGGSITRPAAYCGIAGCKPSFGRVSCAGILPLAPSMDHPGPMANCVRDLAIILDVIGEYSAPNLANANEQQPKIGRIRGLFDDLAVQAVHVSVDKVQANLEEKGASVTELALPGSFAPVLDRHRKIMAVGAAMYHEDRFRRYPDDYDPNITQLIEEGLACTATEYGRCMEHKMQLTQDMETLFSGVDVLLCPATTDPAPDTSTTGNPAFNSPWSYTGFPTISLPVGWTDDGLPLSIQLVGPKHGEEKLFRAALWCERVVNFERRKIPIALRKI